MLSSALYISTAASDERLAVFCAEYDWRLHALPMISFQQISFVAPEPEEYDWIFFTSKRSVDFFMSLELPEKTKKMAVIGKSTARALEEWGFEAAFVGERSGDPDHVAEFFIKKVKSNEKVLFPQSSISNRSIQRRLAEEQCLNLVVYETFTMPRKIAGLPKVLVFSSPSNVRGFLQMNQISPLQTIIAWGKTTAHFLKQSNVRVDYVLEDSSYDALLPVLKEIAEIKTSDYANDY